MEPGLEYPTTPAAGDLAECPDCKHHFQVDWNNAPGSLQEGCPDCGSTRMWKEQVGGEPSDGRLLNMPEAGEQQTGGNPEATGIREPTVRSPISAFNQGECPFHTFGDDGHCPFCGESYGLPFNDPYVQGDPDASGVALEGDKSSLPLDAGNRGRDDGQNHAHIIAALMDPDDPYEGLGKERYERDYGPPPHAMPCPNCNTPMEHFPEVNESVCPNCGRGEFHGNNEEMEQHFNMPAVEHPLGPYTGTAAYLSEEEQREQEEKEKSKDEDDSHDLEDHPQWSKEGAMPQHADPDAIRALFENAPQTQMGQRAREWIHGDEDPVADFYGRLPTTRQEAPPKPEGPVPLWEPPRPPHITKCRNCKQKVNSQTGECPYCGQLSIIARQSGNVKDEMQHFGNPNTDPYPSLWEFTAEEQPEQEAQHPIGEAAGQGMNAAKSAKAVGNLMNRVMTPAPAAQVAPMAAPAAEGAAGAAGAGAAAGAEGLAELAPLALAVL